MVDGPYDAGDHALRDFAHHVGRADAQLAPRITAPLLTEVLALVPDVWLAPDTTFASTEAARAAYLEFLLIRMAHRESWLPDGAT